MKKSTRIIGMVFLLASLLVSAVPILAESDDDALAPFETVDEDLRNLLNVPMQKRVEAILNEKNGEGFQHRRGRFSEKFRKLDDTTYQTIFIERTAGRTILKVDRFLLTLKNTEGRKWEIAKEELLQSYDGMRRSWDIPTFRSFESLSFEREGMKVTGGPGQLYLSVYEGNIRKITATADNMAWEYRIPERVSRGGYYSNVKGRIDDRFASVLDFSPAFVDFHCDPTTCNEILESVFKGLDDTSIPFVADDAGWFDADRGDGDPKLRGRFAKDNRELKHNMKDNPFGGFFLPYKADRRTLAVDILKNKDDGVFMQIDTYEPEEVKVGMHFENVEGGTGYLLTYYSEETWNAGIDKYELEQRPDLDGRDHEIYSLSGEVDCALEDPEVLRGKVTYELNLKRDLTELPYFLSTIKKSEGEEKRNPSLNINRAEVNGEEMLVLATGSYGGIIVLPEEMKAGTRVKVFLDFTNRGIYKLNYAYSGMSRGGWLPFVRFTDKIEKFELITRVPSEYKTLGIGHLEKEETADGVTTSYWKADSPVTFPTIIFGRYIEGRPSKDTPDVVKSDGTVVPVVVHVDEVSMGNWEIRGKQLVPIANQAASALDYYRRISGVDYPFKMLNLVNDPAPAMYGQAPASLIYLGSLVFRGEGIHGVAGGGTDTAKFLKSVVAHEVGHQWWGAVISNSNSRNYWFVETMAEYFSALWLEAHYGPKEYQEQVDEWRRRILEIELLASVQRSTTDYTGEFPGAAYQSAVYNKGPYAFHVLRKTFGDEKFFQFIKGFTQELAAIGEITTLDIQKAAEKHLGGVDANGEPYTVDLGWFFDQWIRGIGIPEYRFTFDSRKNEDGNWIVEGMIEQRLMMGSTTNKEPLPGEYYRGLVPVTVTTDGGQEYKKNLVVEGKETAFRLLLPERPREILFNKDGDILAHANVINKPY